jgi:hypothetical protein
LKLSFEPDAERRSTNLCYETRPRRTKLVLITMVTQWLYGRARNSFGLFVYHIGSDLLALTSTCGSRDNTVFLPSCCFPRTICFQVLQQSIGGKCFLGVMGVLIGYRPPSVSLMAFSVRWAHAARFLHTLLWSKSLFSITPRRFIRAETLGLAFLFQRLGPVPQRSCFTA